MCASVHGGGRAAQQLPAVVSPETARLLGAKASLCRAKPKDLTRINERLEPQDMEVWKMSCELPFF